MNYFVAVISKDYQKNYEVCKLRGLWGMASKYKEAERVKNGDKILFYISGVGFKAEAEALESLRELSGDDWRPYDFRRFKYGFRVEFITEFLRPHKYNFSRNINNDVGIKPGQLRRTFFRIEKWQYENIVLGKGQISPTVSLFST